MDNYHPKITVLMPVYNGEKFLGEAIESILAQSYKSFDFLIINDGSIDQSLNIMESYRDNRIQIINNDIHKGFTRSLNIGLEHASGKYIARMDSDDISLPNRLLEQVTYLEKNPDTGILGSDIEYIGEGGKKLTNLKPPELPVSPMYIKWTLLFRCCLNHPSVMIRRSLLENLSGYDPYIPYAQDYDLWLRAASKTKITNIPKPLVKIRKHSKNISRLHRGEQKQIGVITARREIIRNLGLSPDEDDVKLLHDKNRIKSKEEVLQVTVLIIKLYEAFISKNKIASYEYFIIRLHAYSMIGKIFFNHGKNNIHNFLFLLKTLLIIEPGLIIAVPLFSLLKITRIFSNLIK